MSLFCDPIDIDSYGRNLAQLLLIGGMQLETLAGGQEKVTFKPWAKAVALDAAKRGMKPDEDQLAWLWEAHLSEPKVAHVFRACVVSRDEEWKDQKPMPVLKGGELLGVFLKPFQAYGGPALVPPDQLSAQATIRLVGALCMRPGKPTSRRFECSDVACEVEIGVQNIGTSEQEAVLLKLDASKVKINGKTVTAEAKSLNHAYTLVSRRLEPKRRNAGGRAYDHVARRNSDQWVPLERIRAQVESGDWSIEDSATFFL